MAKGHSSHGSAQGTPSSLTSLLSSPSLPSPVVAFNAQTMVPLGQPWITPSYPLPKLSAYHPAPKHARPAFGVIRSATRLIAGHGTVVGFRVPNLVGICVRRKIRREVLHALRRTNKGRGGSRRRNLWSHIKC